MNNRRSGEVQEGGEGPRNLYPRKFESFEIGGSETQP